MEAIAELHRRAFLMVNPDDKDKLTANVQIQSSSSATQPSVTPTVDMYDKEIKYLQENHPNSTITHDKDYIFSVDKEKYLVSNNKGVFEADIIKDTEIKETEILNFDLKEAQKNTVKYIDDLIQQFLKMIPDSVIDKPLTDSIIEINNNYSIYPAIGDGNCSLHCVLHLSKTYQTCDTDTKITLCDMFRVYIAMYAYDSIQKIKSTPPILVLNDNDKKNIGWPKNWSQPNPPTFKQAVELKPRESLDTKIVDHKLFVELLFNIKSHVILVTDDIETKLNNILENLEDKINIAMYNRNGDHFDIVMTNGDNPTPILAQPKAGGGTTKKKVKTRKSRIFKKWKSRRRRM